MEISFNFILYSNNFEVYLYLSKSWDKTFQKSYSLIFSIISQIKEFHLIKVFFEIFLSLIHLNLILCQ